MLTCCFHYTIPRRHKALVVELAQKVQSTNAAAEKYELRYSECVKIINTLKVAISSMFEKLECKSSSMAELMTETVVTENNMMQFLGMIEHRAHEIIQK